MLVFNVVKYSVIGFSLFFGTVNAMNLDDGKCAEIGSMAPGKVISTAKGRNDEGLKELLTKAAGDDGLLKKIVDYLGSAESNSDEAHLVSSCMHYLREDVYAEFGHLSEKGIQWAKVNKLFGHLADNRVGCDGRCISTTLCWELYKGVAEPIICEYETNQEFCF